MVHNVPLSSLSHVVPSSDCDKSNHCNDQCRERLWYKGIKPCAYLSADLEQIKTLNLLYDDSPRLESKISLSLSYILLNENDSLEQGEPRNRMEHPERSWQKRGRGGSANLRSMT